MFSFRMLLGLLVSFCLIPSLVAAGLQQLEPTTVADAILTASPGEFANKGQNMGSFAIARSVLVEVDEAVTSFKFPDSELSISNLRSPVSDLQSPVSSLQSPVSSLQSPAS